ncbi:CPSF30 [Symbiodinium microadriaticum]|nr:CPSF30 [Symbiodinium microadriaticum]CAE7931520.1 CPSF30 [Symbiodinium sp. KB8]
MDLSFAAEDAEAEWADGDDDVPAVVDGSQRNGPSKGAAAATATALPSSKKAFTGSRPPSKIHGNPATRYFVIKSSSHKNLVLSIEHKVWATPSRQNQEKLNEAFRTAPHVILLFSVNGSGCFQGYAKMLGPVGHVSTDVFEGFGRSFEVRWLRLDDLDFSEVSDIVNPWNENRSVKVSRDGQELPHAVGRQVCELVDHRVFTAEPSGYIDDSQEVETATARLESVPVPAPAPICPNGRHNGPAAQTPHPGSLAPYPLPHPAAVPQITAPPVLAASPPHWGMGGRAFAPPFSSHPHHAWWPPPGSFQAPAKEPSLSSSSESVRRHRRSRKERDPHNSLTGGHKRRRREVTSTTMAGPGEPAGQRTEQVRSPTVPPSGWAGAAPTAPTTSRSVMPPSAWLGASPNEGRK